MQMVNLGMFASRWSSRCCPQNEILKIRQRQEWREAEGAMQTEALADACLKIVGFE